jgi:hypothetical protein
MSTQTELTATWIENKSHYVFRSGETKLAYARADGKKWKVMDGGYQSLTEVTATTGLEAVERVIAMWGDGSLQRLIDERHERATARRHAGMRVRAELFEKINNDQRREAELRPLRDPIDGFEQPVIRMTRETYRLLRAVAIKRTAKIPGETPSTGAVVEGLIELHRADLEREAGALLKRELAKKR